MSTFKSTKRINKPVSEVYEFLADLNNHEQLMPADISEWSSTVDEASFNVRNMLKLSLKAGQRIPDKLISIIPAAKPPFELELQWQLSGNEQQTEVSFIITAKLDMMMKMLASGPLQKLADEETARLFNILH